jgi:hypothetical protein
MKSGTWLSENEIKQLSMHFAKKLTLIHAPSPVHPDEPNWTEPIQETVSIFYKTLDAFLEAFNSQNEERRTGGMTKRY